MSSDGRFQWWVTPGRARALGCTHHARFLGIVPGFYGEADAHWVSRSDIFNPVEDALSWLMGAVCAMRGEEPTFFFAVGREIKGGRDE